MALERKASAQKAGIAGGSTPENRPYLIKRAPAIWLRRTVGTVRNRLTLAAMTDLTLVPAGAIVIKKLKMLGAKIALTNGIETIMNSIELK
jgi:hypothetical protein